MADKKNGVMIDSGYREFAEKLNQVAPERIPEVCRYLSLIMTGMEMQNSLNQRVAQGVRPTA